MSMLLLDSQFRYAGENLLGFCLADRATQTCSSPSGVLSPAPYFNLHGQIWVPWKISLILLFSWCADQSFSFLAV